MDVNQALLGEETRRQQIIGDDYSVDVDEIGRPHARDRTPERRSKAERTQSRELRQAAAAQNPDGIERDMGGDARQRCDDRSVARQYGGYLSSGPGLAYCRDRLDECAIRSVKLVALVDAKDAHGGWSVATVGRARVAPTPQAIEHHRFATQFFVRR